MDSKIAFSENLKHYREKARLTQNELANKIGYTSKSISKWENGCGMPTVEILTELASIFQISLDALVYAKPTHHYLLGIDGGGTTTEFKLTDEQGVQLRSYQCGSCNPNDLGMSKALTVLEDGIKKVTLGIPCSQIVMYAGISGGGMSGNNIHQILEFFHSFGFCHFENGSDVENVLALIPKYPCILVIMGTGFIAYRIDHENRKRIGGWGQFFDQGGSGYSLGRDCITAALRDIDGSGPSTILTRLLHQRLGESADHHIPRFYDGGKQYIASFADLVFSAAEQNDPAALQILEDNMQYVSQIIQTAQAGFSEPVPVYFSGGIIKQNKTLFPLIQKYLSDSTALIALKQAQIDGAVLRAKQLLQKIQNQE